MLVTASRDTELIPYQSVAFQDNNLEIYRYDFRPPGVKRTVT
jgi:hypothetical protein